MRHVVQWLSSSVVECRDGIPEALGLNPSQARYFFDTCYIVKTQDCLVKSKYIFTGRRKLHFTLSDGRELAEEYDLKTNELVGKLCVV